MRVSLTPLLCSHAVITLLSVRLASAACVIPPPQTPGFVEALCEIYSLSDFTDALHQPARNVYATLHTDLTVDSLAPSNLFFFVDLNGFSFRTSIVGARQTLGIYNAGKLALLGPTPISLEAPVRGRLEAGGDFMGNLRYSAITEFVPTASLTIHGDLDILSNIYPVFRPTIWSTRLNTNGFTIRIVGNVTAFGGQLVKTGQGTLVLLGDNRGITNGIRVERGVLQVRSDPSLGLEGGYPYCYESEYGCVSAPLTLAGGTLQAGAVFRVSRETVLDREGGTIDTNGFTLTLGSLSGPGSLVKIGAGTLTLAGPASYRGATTVASGTLQLAAADALPDATALTLADTATLDVAGYAASVGSVAGAGSVLLGRGSLTVGSNNSSTLFSGTISGAGSLRKVGAGGLLLSGANSYTGGTFVDAGTLIGTTHSLQGPIVNNGTVAFLQDAAGTFDSVISGVGTVLKDGAGTMAFAQAQVYTGLTEIAAGELHITGLNGGVDVAAGATLTGAGAINGDVEVRGTLHLGAPTAAPTSSTIPEAAAASTLTIGGDLWLTNTGTLEMSLGNPDSLHVTGLVAIDDAHLAITDVPTTMRRVNTIRLFTAVGGATGNFSSVTSTVPLDVLLTARGATTYATFERTDIPLASVAGTGNARAVAMAIDVLRPHATTDLRSVIREIGALDNERVTSALSQLGGTLYARQARVAALDGQFAIRSVSDHLGDLRDLDDGETSRSVTVTPAVITARSSVWFRSNDQTNSVGGSATSARVDGGLFGVDHRVGRGWLAGAFGGFDRGRLADEAESDLADRRYRAGAYVSRSDDRVYFDAAIGVSRHTYEASRRIAFAAQLDPVFGGGPLTGGISRTTTSQVAGWETSGFVATGINFRPFRSATMVRPFVAVEWSRVGRNRFVEKGGGSIALTAPQLVTRSVRPEFGTRISDVGAGRWHLRGEARYAREVADATAPFTAALVSAAEIGFTTYAEPLGRNALIASMGIAWASGRRFVLSTDYRGSFETHRHVHALMFGVAF